MFCRKLANGFLALLTVVFASVLMWTPAAVKTEAPVPDIKYKLMDIFEDDTHEFFNELAPFSGINLYGDPDDGDLLGIRAYNGYLRALNEANPLPEIVIAVMDSGINDAHPIFDGRFDYNGEEDALLDLAMDFSDYDHIDGKPGAPDTSFLNNGHGTHVAGTIADVTLPNVKILPVKVFGTDENPPSTSMQKAAEYLVDLKENHGINISAVNMSFGTDPSYRYGTIFYKTCDYMQDKIIDPLRGAGILPIVAGGNGDETPNGRVGAGPYYPSVPAFCQGVIAVSSYNSAEFVGSNAASKMKTSKFANYGDYITLAAPGEKIWSADKDNLPDSGESILTPEKSALYDSLTGTSMSTPFVTAAYAMLLSDTSRTLPEHFGEGFTWGGTDSRYYMNEKHKALVLAAADFGDTGNDMFFGYGSVNVSAFAVEPAETNLETKPTISHESPTPVDDTRRSEPLDIPNMVVWGAIIAVLAIFIYALRAPRKNKLEEDAVNGRN